MTWGLSTQQLANLATLAAYLESLPKNYKHFGMANFVFGEYWLHDAEVLDYAEHNGGVDKFGCGTNACAVGHGPAAGILMTKDELESGQDRWTTYSYNNFVPEKENALWQFLFGGNWDYYDDHHWGAAARIRYILDGGGCVYSVDPETYAAYRITRRKPLPKALLVVPA